MIILAIITGLISLISGLAWFFSFRNSDWYQGNLLVAILFWLFGIIWVIVFLLCFRVNTGTKTLTGYIYSSQTRFGYIVGHIRFSEQAGADVQPAFCTKADSEAGRAIKEHTGSGRKVVITEPPYFYLTNNPFACGTTGMKVELVDSTGETQ